MIIALLFLILFALLFPGTLRVLFVLLLLGAIMALGGAHAQAKPVQCFLRVDGKVYIDNICNYDRENDGSFTIGAGQNRRRSYFVYMNHNDDGTMNGYWNGLEAESHAHESLGVLSRSEACWGNDRAKVCATTRN